jgi:hypothetical protein
LHESPLVSLTVCYYTGNFYYCSTGWGRWRLLWPNSQYPILLNSLLNLGRRSRSHFYNLFCTHHPQFFWNWYML